MKHVIALSLCLTAAPAFAQDSDAPSLIERGAQMFLEGLMKEMEPALGELEKVGPSLRSFAQEMGPALTELLENVEDWTAYQPPEVLPNGDIIIRRKTPDAPAPKGFEPIPDDSGQIEL